MSLINEALKKAQRQRQRQAAAPPPPQADLHPAESRPIVRRRPPVSANKVAAAVGLIVLGFALVGGLAFTFFIPRVTEPELVTRPARPPATPAGETAPPPPPADETAPAPAAITPAPSDSPPVSFPATGTPPPTVAPAPAPPVTPAPAITTTPTPAAVRPAPTPAPAERNPRIIAYVEALRVAGIRPSDTDPRVLMNDRVFRLNDVVDRNLGLRLTAVEAQRLVFTDEAGFDYEKRF